MTRHQYPLQGDRQASPLIRGHKAVHELQSSVYDHSPKRYGDDLPGGSGEDRYVGALTVQNADQSS